MPTRVPCMAIARGHYIRVTRVAIPRMTIPRMAIPRMTIPRVGYDKFTRDVHVPRHKKMWSMQTCNGII